MHPVPEHDEAAGHRGRRDRGQFEIRRGLRPKRALGGIAIHGECVKRRRAERAEPREIQRARVRHRRGDEMFRRLVRPEDARLLRAGLRVEVAGALEIAAAGGPVGARGVGEGTEEKGQQGDGCVPQRSKSVFGHHCFATEGAATRRGSPMRMQDSWPSLLKTMSGTPSLLKSIAARPRVLNIR